MKPSADHGEKSYEGIGRLEGHKALITGADSGIGRAVALAFAREGADVAISYLSEEEDARETERLVKEAGCKSILLPGDIGQASICEAVARDAIDALGGITVLVNNAAYQRNYEKLEEISDDEFEEAYRVNVFAMFRLCKAILPQMKEGSSIINTASIQSFDPTSGLIAYASTKAAIASFTRSLAGLAIKQGVRVNAVAPGPVWTPLIPSTLPPERAKNLAPIRFSSALRSPPRWRRFLYSSQAPRPPTSPERSTGRPEAKCLFEPGLTLFKPALSISPSQRMAAAPYGNGEDLTFTAAFEIDCRMSSLDDGYRKTVC